MLNQPPAPGIPGMSDTLEFVKNLWGSMNVPGVSIPGMAAPALTTEELDKKIADLKAVEAWLNLNGTMLRGTIQTLEVQRGTVAALQSMGASFAQAMKPPGDDKTAAGGQSQPGGAAMPAAIAWWNLLEEQFRQAVTSAMSPEAMPHLSINRRIAGGPSSMPESNLVTALFTRPGLFSPRTTLE